MHRGLLVTNQYVTNLILLEQFVIQEEDGANGGTEDVFDLFLPAGT